MADPMNVPGLGDLINGCIGSRNSDVVFEEPRRSGSVHDAFAALFPEIRFMIMRLLSRRDVANLRLASPGFSQLPQTYFRYLVESEMPWVWEVESIAPKQVNWYQLWCDLAAADGGSYSDEKERAWINQRQAKAYEDASAELGSDSHFRNRPAWKECVAKGLKEAHLEIKAAMEKRTWLRRKETELKGLRNRRRIYGDIEEILRRIASLELDGDDDQEENFSWEA